MSAVMVRPGQATKELVVLLEQVRTLETQKAELIAAIKDAQSVLMKRGVPTHHDLLSCNSRLKKLLRLMGEA